MTPHRPDRYSRMVAWLKVLLPLLALGILSSMFLFSKPRAALQGIGSTEARLVELARKIGIGKPRFSGKTASGASVYVTASSVRRRADEPGVIDALNIVARMETGPDQVTTATAGKSVLDQNTNIATLSGGVIVDTANGYHIKTAEALIEIDAIRAETTGQVSADGPLGQLTAGRMELYERQDATGPALVIVFKDGVKLVYGAKNNND